MLTALLYIGIPRYRNDYHYFLNKVSQFVCLFLVRVPVGPYF